MIEPIYDELFSSWIYRGLHDLRSPVRQEHVMHMYEKIPLKCTGRSEYEDYDFDFYSPNTKVLLAQIKIPPEKAESIFGPAFHTPLDPRFRFSYCDLCLSEDFANGIRPAWRKSWCFVECPFCLKHSKLLLISTSSRNFERAFWAHRIEYNWECAEDDGVFQYPTKWMLHSSEVRNEVGIKSQRWLLKILEVSSTQGGSNQESIASAVAAQVLFALLLQVDCGIARYSFGGQRRRFFVRVNLRFIDRLRYGARNSTPYQRMMAMILTAWIFDALTEQDLAAIQRCALEDDIEWPASLYELGAWIAPTVGRGEYQNLLSILCMPMLSEFVRERLDPLLCGIKNTFT